jgi:hypothetical protein
VALGQERRMIRIMALTTAASMIEDYVSSGVDYDDIGLTEKQLEIMDAENKKIADRLRTQASKLQQGDEY